MWRCCMSLWRVHGTTRSTCTSTTTTVRTCSAIFDATCVTQCVKCMVTVAQGWCHGRDHDSSGAPPNKGLFQHLRQLAASKRRVVCRRCTRDWRSRRHKWGRWWRAAHCGSIILRRVCTSTCTSKAMPMHGTYALLQCEQRFVNSSAFAPM